jgi:hypothetical protein
VFFVTLMGTGSVSMDYSAWWHGIFAGTMFLAGMAYCVCHAMTVRALRAVVVRTAADGFWYRWKIGTAVAMAVTAVVYVVILGAVQGRQGAACKGDNWCEIRNIRNVIEFGLVGLLNLYFVSFSHDLKDYCVKVTPRVAPGAEAGF